jgi:transcriptional regulator with XRE-family HTH domain
VVVGLLSAGMATKSQHAPAYRPLMALLRALREEAELTQRDLGERLGKPQSWIHNCEVGNRRVDVAEFAAWARACGVEPQSAFARFLNSSAKLDHANKKSPGVHGSGTTGRRHPD